MKVGIFYFYQGFLGGASSVTVHLYRGLQLAGHEPIIFRVRANSEHKPRRFSGYEGVEYINTSPEESLRVVGKIPTVMTAAAHSKHLQFRPTIIHDLIRKGMRVITHDPNEFKVYDYLKDVKQNFSPIIIRPTMKDFFPKAKLILNPYVRTFNHADTQALDDPSDRKWNAVSVARVTFVKRPEIIIDANKELPREKWCILHGAENRMYTKFKLGGTTWRKYYAGGTPLVWGSAAKVCAQAKFAVDMTYFPNDGGGSQYSLMEAWDAGAINIVHEDWLRYPGEMKRNTNCLAIDSPANLAKTLRDEGKYEDVIEAGFKSLKKHDACKIAQQYVEELTR